jgi:branched-chain amino acid transport system ATP-binding protein
MTAWPVPWPSRREFAAAYPLDLPYGHQRHVEIARALASEPKILLLDEPTAGMNHSEREEVGDLLLELNRDGLTQVLVEHDLAMIHRLCSHTFVLNFGRVIAEGTPSQVSHDPAVREAYLGHGADGQRAAQSAQAAPL